MADEISRFQAHNDESAAKKAAVLDARAREQKMEKDLRIAIDGALKTPAGRGLFIVLFHLCGYNRSSTVTNPTSGEVLPLATQHNEGMRRAYIELRKRATPELLAPVEYEAEFGVDGIEKGQGAKPNA